MLSDRLLARAATASARESRAAGVEPTAARALQARALEHLEAAVTDGFADDAALRADPDLGSLRRDPRFAALVARIRR